MINEMTGSLVRSLLLHVAPSAPATKVAEWVKDKNFRVADLDTLEPVDIRDMGSDECKALGDRIYDAYCRARGIARVHAPENLGRALDLVAQKFRFADSRTMRERSGPLCSDVMNRLETFAWRENYLTSQMLADKDLLFAVNTWFKTWRESWTETKKAFFEQCQTEHIKKGWRAYEPAELFEAVQDFMCAYAGQEYNYNQVADGLQIAATPTPGALPQRMKVKDALEKLSNLKQNVYEDVYKYVTRPNVKGKKSTTVYIWAPLRRELDRHPKRRDVIISRVITAYVRANPDCSQSEIKDAVRAALGQSDNKMAIGVLSEMVVSKLIQEPRKGPHNTYMYRVVEDTVDSVNLVKGSADKPPAYNPKDIFGVDALTTGEANAERLVTKMTVASLLLVC